MPQNCAPQAHLSLERTSSFRLICHWTILSLVSALDFCYHGSERIQGQYAFIFLGFYCLL